MQTAPSLAELQHDFLANILHGDHGIESHIKANGLTASQRMQIYQHIVENTLTEALQTSYPAVRLLVGDDFFDLAADRYMRRYPPVSGNLQDYGAQFSDLLAAMEEAASLAYLPDIARLEWARQLSLLAADAQSLEAAETAFRLQYLGNYPMQMVLHPSVHLVRSLHPVFDIWHFCMQPSGQSLQLDTAGQSVLLWRDGAQIAMQAMDAPAATFLTAVLGGMEMHHAFADVQAQGHVGFDLSELLPFLLSNELIIDIHATGEST